MNHFFTKFVCALGFVFATGACGSSTSPVDGAAGDVVDGGGGGDGPVTDVANDVMSSDTGSSDATDANDAADTMSPSPCPSAEPTMGGTCMPSGLVCTYGDSASAACRDRADCQSGTWTVSMPACTLPMCPATAPTNGDTCTTDQALCAFSDGTRCTCSSCPPGGPACHGTTLNWYCSPPPSDPNCPTQMPNLGDACAHDGTMCDYGGCRGGWAVQCTGGIWVQVFTPCPA